MHRNWKEGKMAENLIQNVSDTAFLVAMNRAIETGRPDALFHDPLAERLAGDHGRKIVENLHRKDFSEWTVAIRTIIIDDYIQYAISEGIDTILNLGAGLDSRPYRMNIPKTLRWIEIDYPTIIAYKENRLMNEKPNCRLERVRMDLTDSTARQNLFREAGSHSKGILVLTEGVVPYLSVEETALLADDIRRISNIRFWIAEYISPLVLKYRQSQARKRQMRNAPFRFKPTDWFGFFEQHGWRPREIRYFVDESKRLKRPIPLRGASRMMIRTLRVFMSLERKDVLRKSAGYVMFEPK
jgi:methyltransferase (TIGR00027 family)